MSLTDDKIRLIVDAVIKRKSPIEHIAERYDITKSRVYQILTEYKKVGYYPQLKKRGRKPVEISESVRKQIIDAKKKFELGSAWIAKYLRVKHRLHIGNMQEYSILLLKETYEKYLYIKPIHEVISDHGTQFYANTRDSFGETDHTFGCCPTKKGLAGQHQHTINF